MIYRTIRAEIGFNRQGTVPLTPRYHSTRHQKPGSRVAASFPFHDRGGSFVEGQWSYFTSRSHGWRTFHFKCPLLYDSLSGRTVKLPTLHSPISEAPIENLQQNQGLSTLCSAVIQPNCVPSTLFYYMSARKSVTCDYACNSASRPIAVGDTQSGMCYGCYLRIRRIRCSEGPLIFPVPRSGMPRLGIILPWVRKRYKLLSP